MDLTTYVAYSTDKGIVLVHKIADCGATLILGDNPSLSTTMTAATKHSWSCRVLRAARV